LGQRISYVSNWDKWGLDLAVLVNGIIGAENYLCGIFGADNWCVSYWDKLGKRCSCVSYWDNCGREIAMLVTGIIGAEN